MVLSKKKKKKKLKEIKVKYTKNNKNYYFLINQNFERKK
jgi:hypothetical protein